MKKIVSLNPSEKHQQVRVVLVNKKDKVVGFKEKLAAHKNPVPLHRAISIVIFNQNKNKILITKRSGEKPTWPGFWSNAVCTHPYPNESYSQAAKRRLFEELGFKAPVKEEFRLIYKARMNKTWGEHEYDVVFVGKYEGPIHPNPDEIVGYEWIETRKLKWDVLKNPDKYTPWFKRILDKLFS